MRENNKNNPQVAGGWPFIYVISYYYSYAHVRSFWLHHDDLAAAAATAANNGPLAIALKMHL